LTGQKRATQLVPARRPPQATHGIYRRGAVTEKKRGLLRDLVSDLATRILSKTAPICGGAKGGEWERSEAPQFRRHESHPDDPTLGGKRSRGGRDPGHVTVDANPTRATRTFLWGEGGEEEQRRPRPRSCRRRCESYPSDPDLSSGEEWGQPRPRSRHCAHESHPNDPCLSSRGRERGAETAAIRVASPSTRVLLERLEPEWGWSRYRR
jgi:hypothetical protein